MQQREAFIHDHRHGLYPMQELCARYGISRKTGYKFTPRAAAPPSGTAAVPRVPARIVCFQRPLPDWRLFGLPWAIRADNGVPFATTGIHGLSQLNVWLNVWWMRLGILPDFIDPASPPPYPAWLPSLEYPGHDEGRRGSNNGGIRSRSALYRSKMRSAAATGDAISHGYPCPEIVLFPMPWTAHLRDSRE